MGEGDPTCFYNLFCLPPQCGADVGVGMEQDDERDEEVSKAVEDDIEGDWNVCEVTPTATIRQARVTPHLVRQNKYICSCIGTIVCDKCYFSNGIHK